MKRRVQILKNKIFYIIKIFCMSFNNEEIERFKNANKKLGIGDSPSNPRDNNLIIVYSSPKVGSTSLVSSLRLSLNHKYTILHIHNERMLKLLYNIDDVSVMELIKYNGMIGKKVFVFDVFRTEMEQKQSLFFENIDTFHFNVPLSVLNKYDINILINRFNNIFHETIISDHFKSIYNIECPAEFDHVNKYLMIEKENVKFIKLRLKDSNIWSKIIGNIMHENIALMKDYQTSSKDCKDLYNSFKSLYFIPTNILENIEKSESLKYYYSPQEYDEYIRTWKCKCSDEECRVYSKEEYDLYTKISVENRHQNEIQQEHYFDDGCVCKICNVNRQNVLRLMKNNKPVSLKRIGEHHKNKKLITQALKDNILFDIGNEKRKKGLNMGLNMFK